MARLAQLTSQYRSRLIAQAYKKWLSPKKKVLDVGCGSGVVSVSLQKTLKISVTGCDIMKYLAENISFVQMQSESKLPFKNNSFDVAMCNDVLHHMSKNNQKKLLLETLRVADKVLIFEVQPTFWGKIFDFILNKIHNFHMHIPFTFRTVSQWISLFEELHLQYDVQFVSAPRFYPFSHVAFQIKK